MFKIGEFSRISCVPVKTLRYYDEIGLLAPDRVDKFTGYRYYSLDQLPRLNRILALKDLGLSLAQIGILLNENITAKEIRGMLRLKQAEIRQRVDEEQARLLRVETRLRQIEQEGKMPDQEVVIKTVKSQKVLSIRETIPTPDYIGRLFQETFGAIMPQGIQPAAPPFTIYHDIDFKSTNLDVEVVIPVNPSVTNSLELDGGRKLTVRELPGIKTAACIIHHGEYERISETYGVIGQWISDNDYRIIGPVREIYLTSEGSKSDAVTEIQFPVEKA